MNPFDSTPLDSSPSSSLLSPSPSLSTNTTNSLSTSTSSSLSSLYYASRCGFLWRQSLHVKSWDRRFYVLRDGVIFASKSAPKMVDDVISSPYSWMKIDSQSNVRRETATNNKKNLYVFSVLTLHPADGRSFIHLLGAEEESERELWISAIQKQIDMMRGVGKGNTNGFNMIVNTNNNLIPKGVTPLPSSSDVSDDLNAFEIPISSTSLSLFLSNDNSNQNTKDKSENNNNNNNNNNNENNNENTDLDPNETDSVAPLPTTNPPPSSSSSSSSSSPTSPSSPRDRSSTTILTDFSATRPSSETIVVDRRVQISNSALKLIENGEIDMVIPSLRSGESSSSTPLSTPIDDYNYNDIDSASIQQRHRYLDSFQSDLRGDILRVKEIIGEAEKIYSTLKEKQMTLLSHVDVIQKEGQIIREKSNKINLLKAKSIDNLNVQKKNYQKYKNNISQIVNLHNEIYKKTQEIEREIQEGKNLSPLQENKLNKLIQKIREERFQHVEDIEKMATSGLSNISFQNSIQQEDGKVNEDNQEANGHLEERENENTLEFLYQLETARDALEMSLEMPKNPSFITTITTPSTPTTSPTKNQDDYDYDSDAEEENQNNPNPNQNHSNGNGRLAPSSSPSFRTSSASMSSPSAPLPVFSFSSLPSLSLLSLTNSLSLSLSTLHHSSSLHFGCNKLFQQKDKENSQMSEMWSVISPNGKIYYQNWNHQMERQKDEDKKEMRRNIQRENEKEKEREKGKESPSSKKGGSAVPVHGHSTPTSSTSSSSSSVSHRSPHSHSHLVTPTRSPHSQKNVNVSSSSPQQNRSAPRKLNF